MECKFEYKYEINFGIYKNCYNNCLYYYYFDEINNKFYCTNKSECPINYNKLIEDKRECISSCEKDDKYKYEFKTKCYKKCPSNTTEREIKDEYSFFSLYEYFCKPICNENVHFEIIYRQECVENCRYNELKNKSCILIYKDSINDRIYTNLLNNAED